MLLLLLLLHNLVPGVGLDLVGGVDNMNLITEFCLSKGRTTLLL